MIWHPADTYQKLERARQAGDYSSAIKFCYDLINWSPELSDPRLLLSSLFFEMDQPDTAEMALLPLFKTGKPISNELKMSLQHMVSLQGRDHDAYEILSRMAEPSPYQQMAYGLQSLKLGLFNQGFSIMDFEQVLEVAHGREYELDIDRSKRLRIDMFFRTSVAKKTILILNDGGIGDEFCFIRFASTLKHSAKAKKVIVACREELIPIFKTVDGIDDAISLLRINEASFDHYIPSQSLPSLLTWNGYQIIHDFNISIIPPYLYTHEHPIKAANEIGIHWQGSSITPDNDRRTLDPLALLAAIPKGFTPISFQRDEGAEKTPQGLKVANMSTWHDTIMALRRLNLLITSDSAIAHVAGAMGLPTFVFVPTGGYHIWGSHEIKEPCQWYPSTVVFHQSKYKDWSKQYEGLIKICSSL